MNRTTYPQTSLSELSMPAVLAASLFPRLVGHVLYESGRSIDALRDMVVRGTCLLNVQLIQDRFRHCCVTRVGLAGACAVAVDLLATVTHSLGTALAHGRTCGNAARSACNTVFCTSSSVLGRALATAAFFFARCS